MLLSYSMNHNLGKAVIKAAKGLWNTFPVMIGTILLISLISVLIPKAFYASVFGDNWFINAIIGGSVGSISAGNPVSSYIISGELLDLGISLMAVTAFLVAWVTVGIIQLPAESSILGMKFALLRNISAFVLAIVVSIVTILIYNVI